MADLVDQQHGRTLPGRQVRDADGAVLSAASALSPVKVTDLANPPAACSIPSGKELLSNGLALIIHGPVQARHLTVLSEKRVSSMMHPPPALTLDCLALSFPDCQANRLFERCRLSGRYPTALPFVAFRHPSEPSLGVRVRVSDHEGRHLRALRSLARPPSR